PRPRSRDRARRAARQGGMGVKPPGLPPPAVTARQRSRDEESRHQTKQYVSCQIGGQAIEASLKRGHHPVHV
ncbi:MAG: hypothetical protein MK097_18620, partial [Dechloromonas sp.]|nr:hypothetical protein [Dechloromonas sp.]